MDALLEHSPEETKRLQRCLNDLISIVTLPAAWSGGDPSQIVQTLVGALFGMLRLDFIYVRFAGSLNESPIEMVRIANTQTRLTQEQILRSLRPWLDHDPSKWPRSVKGPSDDEDTGIFPTRFGLNGELGVIVAGSRRTAFPEETERLVLSVAANQAAMGLQEARRSSEHRRLATELDRQVAQRTIELAQANEALKRELAERARTEEILRRCKLDFRLIVDSIPVPVSVTTPTGEVEGLNQPALDYFGKTFEELKEWTSSDAVHPDDLQRTIAAYRSALETGRTYHVECRHRRADGVYRWFKIVGLPLRDTQGRILRWFHLQIDIDDRKQAEIHLSGEKQILEMIASGRSLRDVLKALCKFFEVAATDCFCGIYPIDGRGKTIQYGVAPTLPDSYTAPIDGVPVSFDDSPRGQSISTKTQVIAEDMGSDPRWMAAPCRAHVLEHGLRAVWSTPICSGEGSVIGTVCVYQEKPGSPSAYHQELIAHVAHLASIAIERSQAEAALRRSETFLTEGQRISLTGSFFWRVDTDELTFSEQLHRIFELEPSAKVTLDEVAERVHPDDLPTLAQKMAEVRSGKDNLEYEIRLRMPDGRVKYLRVFGRAMRHEDDRLECLGAAQDVTRRRLAEEARDKVRSELAQVSRVVSLGALTASIAHEINQPLASIITNGETGLRWLARPEPDLEKVQRLTKRVVGDARRAAEIIDRIRNMASRGATKQSVIALAEIVTESVAFLHHEFQSRGASLSLDLTPDLPKVVGDRTQLQQIIVNLTINALQALTKSEAASKSIVIRTRQIDAERVCCIVEDSGPGIDTEHLPHLFESFFTTKETGMGLGLRIAQSIVEAHGGHIRGDNESSLGGARFIFELPVSASLGG
jgi:PAS domain S-box-containing protein